MDKQMNQTQLPGVLMRDAFRGLRFGARQAGRMLTSVNMPEPIGTAASGFLRKADKLSYELETMSRNSIGGSFRPNALPDASVFSETGLMIETLSVPDCANAARSGLSFAMKTFGQTNQFISEYLCHSVMKQFKIIAGSKTPAEKCLALFELFVEHNVCGIPPGFNVAADQKDQENFLAAYFGIALWLHIPRVEAVSEAEILAHCSQVADSKRSEIVSLRSDKPALKKLFDYYLKII